MRRSTERILVSHAGNLPRPAYLQQLIDAKDTEGFRKRLPVAVVEIVDRQIALGVDVVNDGEYVKAFSSFAGYIQDRLEGFETKPADPSRRPLTAGVGGRDRARFPGTYASGLWGAGSGGPIRPGFMTPGKPYVNPNAPIRVCTGPIKYTGQSAIREDVANLKAAIKGKNVEGFLASIGPRSVSSGYNDHYPDDEAFIMAAAEAMHEEYKAITDAGLIVQIDEPNIATQWQFHPDLDVAGYRKTVELNVAAINHALRGIPAEQVRLHFCWGSGHRPHTDDSDLKDFADILMKVNGQSLSFEAANVRHEHEWKIWRDVKVPDGKILMPGVIAHATDLVEHPELVADRIERYAGIVGKEGVQTGTDCGIGSRVGHEEIVWAKLRTMSDGAKIASERLWGRVAIPA